MAYRRRQVIGRSSTFGEDPFESNLSSSSSSASSSLAAQALKASDAHRHSNGGPTYDYTSMGNTNAGSGLWGVLAKKAKEILDDDSNHSPPHKSEHFKTSPDVYYSSNDRQADISMRIDNPKLRKGIDAFTSSMNRIGDTIGNALEGGRTIVENKTVDFMRRKGSNHLQEQNNLGYGGGTWQHQSTTQSQMNQTSHEDQLKASRDVAMATAAKAKLLLRELKTVKADLAFTKQRCSQLEEENKILRDAREKGVNPADDDMIRLQLETLLAEKARLAHENSVYSRENRFLREIVEYHQLTMQDVVYLDEEDEEVTEVYPIPAVSRRLSSVSSPTASSLSRSSSVSKEMSSLTKEEIRKTEASSPSTSDVQVPKHDQESTRRC